MNISNPTGQLRADPATCGIGDWLFAPDFPDWGSDFSHDRTISGENPRAGLKIFKLFPYVDGKRQLVWIRIG